MVLHIRDVAETYPDGAQTLRDVCIRAKADGRFPRVSKEDFVCSDW